MHPERLGHAGTETVGLNKSSHQRANIVYAGALDQVAQRLGPRLAGSHLQVYQMKLVAQLRMRVVQILAHPHHSLIQCQPGFDADDGEIQCVGQPQLDSLLAALDLAFQCESWRKKPESGDANQQHRGLEAAGGNDGSQSNKCAGEPAADIYRQVARVAISRLNEPASGTRDVAGRQGYGFA